MADKKVTALTAATSVAAEDLFMVVDNPSGTPASKKVSVTNIFGSVPTAAVFTKDVTVSGDNATVSANNTFSGTGNLRLTSATPTTNNPTTDVDDIINNVHSKINLVPTEDNMMETLTMTEDEITSLIEDTADIKMINSSVGKKSKKSKKDTRVLNL